MKKVYICSAYLKNGEAGKNSVRTFLYCRFAYDKGYFPIAPQVYLPNILDYYNANEKAKIFEFCKTAINECDEFWVFGDSPRLGFTKIVDYAIKQNKKIKYFDRFCEPIK